MALDLFSPLNSPPLLPPSLPPPPSFSPTPPSPSSPLSHLSPLPPPSPPSPPRVLPHDERVQRFERAQVMAVCSLRLVFSHLSPDFLQEKAKVWEELLADKKLWKLARHHNPAVSGGGERRWRRKGEG